MRGATAAGLELVLRLRDPDSDPLPGELADFIVIREPGPFVWPRD